MNQKFQDIIPPREPQRRRSIRDIPLTRHDDGADQRSINNSVAPQGELPPKPKRKIKPILAPQTPLSMEDEGKEGSEEYAFLEGSDHLVRKTSTLGVWILAVIGVVVLFFVFSTFFASASVRIVPKKAAVSFNGDAILLGTSAQSALGANLDRSVSTATASMTAATATGPQSIQTVPYKVVIVTAEESTSTAAAGAQTQGGNAPQISGRSNIQAKATGTILIYNNYSSASQALIKTTRLESPSGLIYRLDNDVIVPGRQTVQGKSVPGSATVTVTADQYGVAYNSAPTDFTVIGFKGTPKYAGFYGRSKTSLTGGSGQPQSSPSVPSTSSGSASSIASSTRSADLALVAGLKASLSLKVRDLVNAQKPQGFTYIQGSALLVYDPPQQTTAADGSSVVLEKVTAYAAVVDTAGLQAALKDDALNDDPSLLADFVQSASATDTGPLMFDLSNMTSDLPSNISIGNISSGPVRLSVSGTSSVGSTFNIPALTQAISSLSRGQALLVLKNMTGISDAEISLSPWWKTSLPNADKIKVTIDDAR